MNTQHSRPRVLIVGAHEEASSQIQALRVAAKHIDGANIEVMAASAPKTAPRLSLLATVRRKLPFLRIAMAAARASRRKDLDLVICFHPLVGILCAAMTRHLPRKGRPKIVALTIAIRPQPKGVEFLRKLVYRSAFSHPNFIAGTSTTAGVVGIQSFGKAVRIIRTAELIVDPLTVANTGGGAGVVSGGYSGRSWGYVRDLAEQSGFPIRIMTSEEQWESTCDRPGHRPAGLTVTFDDTKRGFDELLGRADLVIVSLSPSEPAGFLMVRSCALAGIPVVWTTPSCLDDHTPCAYPVLPLHDPTSGAAIVERLMANPTERARIAEILDHFWEDRFDPVEVIEQIIEKSLSFEAAFQSASRHVAAFSLADATEEAFN